MLVVAQVLAFIVGASVVLATLASAIKTVVMPRSEPAVLARSVFVALRKVFDIRIRWTKSWRRADRIMARFAPFGLIILPGVWVTLVLVGFVPIYWAVGIDSIGDSAILSGSSLLTLGSVFDAHGPSVAVTFAEATIGLGLVALLISFLPTMYQQFARREVLVSELETRAGTPPTPIALYRRAHRIGWIDQMDPFWEQWERWFAEIEESHTSYQTLPLFRSPQPDRSWITAAGSAALRVSTIDMPSSWQPQLCVRAGYVALRAIAGAYGIPYDPDPAPTDPISVTRQEYDDVVDQLVETGVPVKADRDQAWRDFAGWRVNYDVPLLSLCGFIMAPPSPWSSDRSVNYRIRMVQHVGRTGWRPA